ncbi:MAG: DNA topoisomerase 4 subunit A [Lachnospiraceae bacterium]|nr:DNA topoisomerase 4 subunit A [Lachnospiraceae bacterium]
MKTVEERIIKSEYSELMEQAYIDYAMSVIVSRALPDARDGLKPVQRRVLYDMRELGTLYDKPYRKCARIVGDTMGKYHPHGDSSIYDALVVLTQDFKKGQPLVDGHGNFGSIEGDGAAAMRYTEARLTKLAQEYYLSDLDKNVVDFVPNFDETEKEPEVLPVRVPNLLINGAEGIAVGMTTSIPTHNLAEVCDAVKYMLKNPDATNAKLMKYIKGPDFPTGGIVVNQDELYDIYNTGSGKIKIRGKVEVEELKGGKEQIVITEIPYTMIGTGISKFLQDVAALVESKKLPDITDISNMSSKEGIRIVLELKKGANTENIINTLYKKTKLQDTFGVNMLAVVDGKPEVMGLKTLIEHHIDFQFDVCTRKYRTLLSKEKEKAEVQEGLIRACDVIDLIIEVIRGSKSRDQVKKCLVEGITDGINFKTKASEKEAKKLLFTDRQADAILDMRLSKLIGLEIEKLNLEHDESLKAIARYEDILNNYDSMVAVISEDLDKVKKEYGRKRRTEITTASEVVVVEEAIKEADVTVLIDRFGYARSIDQSAYEKNKEAADEENKYIIHCKNTDSLVIYTDGGRQHLLKVLDLPYGKFRSKGVPVDNVCTYSTSEEMIVGVYALSDVVKSYLLFTTKQAMMKLTYGDEFDVSRRNIAATKLNDGDELVSVIMARGDEDYIVLETENGYFLKFAFDEIPEKKKGAAGVIGMKLSANDSVYNVYVTAEGGKQKAVTPDDAPLLDMMNDMGADIYDDYSNDFGSDIAISGGSEDDYIDQEQEENEAKTEEINYIVTAKSGAEVDLKSLRVNKRGGKGSKK